jgi:hypothetical protein
MLKVLDVSVPLGLSRLKKLQTHVVLYAIYIALELLGASSSK